MAMATPCEMLGPEILNQMYKSKVTPDEALEYLASTCENLDEFINHASFTQETAGMLIHCIATAFNSESPSSRQQLLQIFQLTSVSKLLTNAGAKLLFGIGADIRHPFSCIVSDILTIIKTWLLVMPHDLGSPQAIGLIELMYKQIQRSLNLENQEILLQEVSQLQTDLLKILADQSKNKNREKSMDAPEDKLRPPEDFRILSVMPEENDLLYQTYFLRKNKVFGSYVNLDHYLDVQFRLYREDCITPLREAFEEFLFKSKEKRTFRMENARIYRDVQICQGTKISLEHGEVFEIELDKEHLRRIHWNNSKRLIFGSLLLLSFDNFKTTYFAVVADSDRAMLQKNGCFRVKLFRTRSNQMIPRETKGIILEATSAYYEAYHHVLCALKSIHKDTFPFEKYIVECNNAIGYPRYLDTEKEITYDLQPIISGGRIVLDHRQSSEVLEERRIPVLDATQWPAKEVFNMDESQRQAFISALTKEFVIIQGPPGTGKTYIGLQIAKCLLHNSSQWASLHVSNSPNSVSEKKNPCLLLVCFTNHALDQFVEGIIDFLPVEIDGTEKKEDYVPKVVRIGNQCKNPKLDKYSLKNIRQEIGKRVPSFDTWQKAKDYKRNVMMIRSALKATKSQNVVLKFSEVKRFISEEHLSNYGEHPEEAWKDWIHISLKSWFEEVQKKRADKRKKKRQKGRGYKDEIIIEARKSVIVDIVTESEYTYSERSLDEDANFIFDCGMIGIDLQQQLNDILENVNDPISQQMLYDEMKLVLIELKSDLVASEDMMKNIKDLWALSISDRFKIYRYWLKKYVDYMKEILIQKECEFQTIFEDYQRARAEIDEEILSHTSVIALTTTGAAKYRESLNKIGPQITIIEEAAEVPEAHIVTAINPKCKHVILIGDHKQLEPKPAVQELAIKYNLSLSLFERMINNGLHYNCLQRQHRMRPEISELVRHMYPALDDNENVKKYENVKGVRKNLFFITHEHEEQYNDDLKSFSNEHEAEFVKELCSYLLKQGYKGSEITIIAAYTSQMMLIRSKMPYLEFEGVNICVLDNYQGEENEIVLLSLVRSNSKGEIGFLKKPNRICVALSRAKKGLYIIGNSTTLTKGSSEWNTILAKIKSGDRNDCSFGKALPLYCQNHSEKEGIFAEIPDDFSKAPDGGCELPCQVRLKCGHVCRRFCHPCDQEHELYRCKQPCYKRCQDGHTCNRRCHCFENCNCDVMVERSLSCSHSARLECCFDQSSYQCQVEVKRLLVCGHHVVLKCYIDFTDYKCKVKMKCKRQECGHEYERDCFDTDFETTNKCGQMVEKTFIDCSHSVTVPCWQDLKYLMCKAHVEKMLQCGHRQIIYCYRSNYHKVCVEKCNKQCENGHICDKVCHFPRDCNCTIKIIKKIPTCGHECSSPCSCDIMLTRCHTEVDIVLDICGHTVRVPCHKKSEIEHLSASARKTTEQSIKCSNQVEVELPRCGHKENVHCWQSVEINSENEQRRYSKLYSIEDRLDIKCMTIVEFDLACGHKMKSECWKKYEYTKNPRKAKLDCKCMVDLKFDCGHIQEVECSVRSIYQTSIKRSGYPDFFKTDIQCCVKVELKLECEHIVKLKCWQKSECEKGNMRILKCKSPVSYIDPNCGHERQIKCFEHLKNLTSSNLSQVRSLPLPTLSPCTFLVQKILVCGHHRTLKCHESEKAICIELCQKRLVCGHLCMELCPTCDKNILHKECEQMCKKQLFCGHNCESQQCMKCKPCTQQCQFACEHSACGLECMKPCKPCVNPCTWVCKHLKCTRLCWEICDRPLCLQDCDLVLSCGHQCPGFCSEPCPVSCMACDRSKYHVSNEENVKFVTIDSCGHSFDYLYLDSYMTKSTNDLVSRCPLCNAVFVKHPRYNELLKMKRKYIEIVKEQTHIFMKSSDCVFPKCDQRIFQQFISYTIQFQKYLNVMSGVERNKDNLRDVTVLKYKCEKILQCITRDKCHNWVDIAWMIFQLHALWVLRLCSKNDELLAKSFKLETNIKDLNNSVFEPSVEAAKDKNTYTSYLPDEHTKEDIQIQNNTISSFSTAVKRYPFNEQHHCTENKHILDVELELNKVTQYGNDGNKCQIVSASDDIKKTLQNDEIADTLTGKQIINKIKEYIEANKHQQIKKLLTVLMPFIKDDMYYNEAINFPKLRVIGVHDDDWKLCQNGHIVPIVVGYDCLICTGEGAKDYEDFNAHNITIPFVGQRHTNTGINDKNTFSKYLYTSPPNESMTEYQQPRGRYNCGRRRPNRGFIQQTRSTLEHKDNQRQEQAASNRGNGSRRFPAFNHSGFTFNADNTLKSNESLSQSSAWNQNRLQGRSLGERRSHPQPTGPPNSLLGYFPHVQPYTNPFQDAFTSQLNPYGQNIYRGHHQRQRGYRGGRKA